VVPEAVEPLAAVEVFAQAESASLEKTVTEEPISQTESVVGDSPQPVNVPQEESVPTTPSAPLSIETQPIELKPQASEKLVPESDSVTVDPPETAQVLSSNEKVFSELELIDSEPPALAESSDVVSEVEMVLEPQSLLAELEASSDPELVPEPQESDPAETPTPVETVPEIQSVTKETIVPVDTDNPVDPIVSVEVLTHTKHVPVLPPVEVEETESVAQEEPSAEDNSNAVILEHKTVDMDCTTHAETLTSEEPKSIPTNEFQPEGIQRNASIDSACSALGKATHKYLRRQPNILDTTPSDGDSPKRPEPVNLLGTICKFYIKDKRLLATIERRRHRSLIMHKYLSSFDSMDDSIEEVPNDTQSNLFEEMNEVSLASSTDLQPPTGRAETPTSEVDPIRFVDECFAFDTDKTETDMIDEISLNTDKSQCLLSSRNMVESNVNDLESEIESVNETSLDTDASHCFVSTESKHKSHEFESETDMTDDDCLDIDASECSNISEDKHEDHLNHLEDVVTVGDNIALRLDMASQTSCDMSEELDVESDSIVAFSLSEITYNFINEILFSDQLSSESIKSDESEPSTACETFNADGDSEQEFVSERVLVLDDQRSLNTNTSSNNNLHNHMHLPLTQTNHPTSGSRRTNGKLTNGSLRWSGSYTTELPNSGSMAVQHDDVADDDVVLLRRFVPGNTRLWP